jgi:predicted RNA methylase
MARAIPYTMSLTDVPEVRRIIQAAVGVVAEAKELDGHVIDDECCGICELAYALAALPPVADERTE